MAYNFFQNDKCEYFPCHKYSFKHFNCLFCFCPLYAYDDCGGKYEKIETSCGNYIKDCSECVLPHKPENYDYIVKKLYDKNKL